MQRLVPVVPLCGKSPWYPPEWLQEHVPTSSVKRASLHPPDPAAFRKEWLRSIDAPPPAGGKAKGGAPLRGSEKLVQLAGGRGIFARGGGDHSSARAHDASASFAARAADYARQLCTWMVAAKAVLLPIETIQEPLPRALTRLVY